MSAELAQRIDRTHERRRARALVTRARIIGAIGPLAILAGIVWAVTQPWRVTLLHPDGQGFWWLFSEPPLFVVLAGLVFHFVVSPSLLRDLDGESE